MKNIHIVKLYPIQDSEYSLLVHKMRKEDIDEWIKKHHPESQKKNTTDSHWNWKMIYYHMLLQNTRRQKIKGYVYRINGEIYGMSIVAYNYPCTLNLDGKKEIKPYLWYMVKSPKSNIYLSQITIDPKHVRLQKYVYDIVNEEIRFKNDSYGLKTLWLHADPVGNNALLEIYKRKGFSICSLSQDKIFKTRKDDGRYLYLPEKEFKKLSISTVRC